MVDFVFEEVDWVGGDGFTGMIVWGVRLRLIGHVGFERRQQLCLDLRGCVGVPLRSSMEGLSHA